MERVGESGSQSESQPDMIKIWRSWHSAFGEFSRHFRPGDDECWTAPEAYTDAELARIRGEGFNAVWVHAQLNQLVRTDVFPELGEHAEELRQRLDLLIERAARHGIAVYLYMQIPRGLPQEHPLWRNHPECAGLPDMYPDTAGEPVIMLPMCTSAAKTREYLRKAAAELARKLPRLAGVILITASEYPSHCYGRSGRQIPDGGQWKFIPVDCPRCLRRTPAEIIAEAIALVAEGIHAESPSMRVIAWNWSWTFFEESPCLNILRRLPSGISLLVDFERGGRRPDGSTVEEYSLGYAGPSERFLQVCSEARRRGLEVLAKFQLGTTHELATAPNLPALENIRRKACRLAALDLKGFMGCWNFGNMPSANVAAFHFFLAHPDLALEDFATDYLPGCDPAKTAEAWRMFTAALETYPFNNSWLYFGPTNFSPALPLRPGPLSAVSGGRSWLAEPVRGDNIAKAFKQCSPEEAIAAFSRLVPVWEQGVKRLREGLAGLESPRAKEELSSSPACGMLFRGALNGVRSYRLKLHWRESCLEEWRRIAADELNNLKRLLPVVEQDSRIGYHIEAHEYLFTAPLIRRKIKNLEKWLEETKDEVANEPEPDDIVADAVGGR